MSIHIPSVGVEQDIIPFGNGDADCGTSGINDADLMPVDVGSDEPQDEDGNYKADMANLRDTLRRTAARIERETGFATRCEALVSSEDAGGGFLVFMSRGGETFMGNSSDLDGAELQARLKASVWLAEQRKAAVGGTDLQDLARRLVGAGKPSAAVEVEGRKGAKAHG